jgi:hypothetical protein
MQVKQMKNSRTGYWSAAIAGISILAFCLWGVGYLARGRGGGRVQSMQAAAGKTEAHQSRESKVPGDIPFYERMEGIPSGVKEGMRLFASQAHYRIAGADDFKIPKWAIDRYGEELQSHINFPVEGGRDINHDGVWHDYGVIVVDVSRGDAQRFGLVIFNAAPKEDAISAAYWLYRDRDLSRTFMSRLGDHFFVIELFEGKLQKTCEVVWDKTLRQYRCE